MDKFKITPDWRELGKMIRLILVATVLFFLVTIKFVTCTDETYIMGYNKDMEEINRAMFEVDSLMMTIKMELDSLNVK